MLITEARSLKREPFVRIERILCPVDFSDVSTKAYRYAQLIACHYRAKLILHHVVEYWQTLCADFAVTPKQSDEFHRKLASNAQDELHHLLDTYGGVQPECVVDEGVAADSILSVARSSAVNLIVMGTQGRRGFDHLMYGSVTERVLRHAPCPVLAIPPKSPDKSGSGPRADLVNVQQILCCVDFSAHSQRSLGHALSVADAFHAGLTILHVLDESTDPVDEVNGVEKLQNLLAASTPSSTRVHFQVRTGKAYREILRFAQEIQPDVIVMGVRGRVFGSTTCRVIQRHPGPVLTIPACP